MTTTTARHRRLLKALTLMLHLFVALHGKGELHVDVTPRNRRAAAHVAR